MKVSDIGAKVAAALGLKTDDPAANGPTPLPQEGWEVGAGAIITSAVLGDPSTVALEKKLEETLAQLRTEQVEAYKREIESRKIATPAIREALGAVAAGTPDLAALRKLTDEIAAIGGHALLTAEGVPGSIALPSAPKAADDYSNDATIVSINRDKARRAARK